MSHWNSERRKARYADAYKTYQAFMKHYPLSLEDLEGEQWRDIDGYEGLYQVSTFGRVKSTNKRKPHILKPVLASSGYLHFCLSKGRVHKNVYCARLVAVAFIPNPDGKPQVNHIDGHVFNNAAINLEWVTQKENQQHAYKLGLQIAPQGEAKCNSKLTNEQVLFIRENEQQLSQREIAEKFNVSQSVISSAQCGNSYKNVGGKIRTTKRKYITDEQRAEIRRLYVPYSREFGTKALAKKFRCGATAIWDIVNGK